MALPLGERIVTVETELREVRSKLNSYDQQLHEINHKLDLLIAEKSSRDGAVGLGKWIAGLGFFTMLGAALLGIFSFFSGGFQHGQ
jgi:hypothetical protein